MKSYVIMINARSLQGQHIKCVGIDANSMEEALAKARVDLSAFDIFQITETKCS